MAINIEIDITKTVEAGPIYKAVFTVVAATGVDANLFVFTFPGLQFDSIVNTDTISRYDVYDVLNPPVEGTQFVRQSVIELEHPSLSKMVSDVATLKTTLNVFAKEYDLLSTNFTGNENFTINIT